MNRLMNLLTQSDTSENYLQCVPDSKIKAVQSALQFVSNSSLWKKIPHEKTTAVALGIIEAFHHLGQAGAVYYFDAFSYSLDGISTTLGSLTLIHQGTSYSPNPLTAMLQSKKLFERYIEKTTGAIELESPSEEAIQAVINVLKGEKPGIFGSNVYEIATLAHQLAMPILLHHCLKDILSSWRQNSLSLSSSTASQCINTVNFRALNLIGCQSNPETVCAHCVSLSHDLFLEKPTSSKLVRYDCDTLGVLDPWTDLKYLSILMLEKGCQALAINELPACRWTSLIENFSHPYFSYLSYLSVTDIPQDPSCLELLEEQIKAISHLRTLILDRCKEGYTYSLPQHDPWPTIFNQINGKRALKIADELEWENRFTDMINRALPLNKSLKFIQISDALFHSKRQSLVPFIESLSLFEKGLELTFMRCNLLPSELFAFERLLSSPTCPLISLSLPGCHAIDWSPLIQGLANNQSLKSFELSCIQFPAREKEHLQKVLSGKKELKRTEIGI